VFIRFDRLLAAGIVAAAAVLSLTQVARAGPPEPVVPGAIEVPDGNKVFLVGRGAASRFTRAMASSGGSSRPGRICTTTTASSSSPTSAGRPGRPRTAAASWAGSRPTSPSTPPPSPGCGCPLLRRPPGPTATGSWTPPTSNGSNHRRPRPARRGMQRDNGRYRGRGPLHRRLLLLEEDRCLTQRRRPEGPARAANRNPQRWARLPARDRSPNTDPVMAMTARHRRRGRGAGAAGAHPTT